MRGIQLDAQTRCVHYHGPTDIVAIKMKCCGTYYACIRCHEALCEHSPQQWPRHQFDQLAVRCGACTHEMTIRTYLDTNQCPQCEAPFNPRCALHYPLYFEL